MWRAARAVLATRWRWAGLGAVALACGLPCSNPAALGAEDRGAEQEWVYTVKAGDTLWDLTERYLTDLSLWPELQQLNRVQDARHLPIGTKLRIPLVWMKVAPAAARFGAVTGEVHVELVPHGVRRKAVKGEALHRGDIVRTEADGYAAVEFFDGSILTLHPDSILRLNLMQAYAAGLSDVRVGLSPGRAETRARAQPEQPSRFEIDTPAGITSVRGTDFRVSVPADERASRSEVLEGDVVVTGAGKAVDVPAGYGTVTRAGEPPGAPVALLPPPDLTALPASLSNLPAALDFPAVTGAVAYRTLLARGDAFNEVLVEAVSNAPQVRLPELPAGSYVLRVRAIDVAHLEGRHAQRTVDVVVRPAPPALIEPEDSAVISTAPLPFRWSPPKRGLGSRFQLARDAGFSELVEDLPALRDSGVVVERALPSGVYYWRVAASSDELGEGPFAEARSFRRLPLAPRLLTPAVDAEAVELRWDAGPAAQRYDAELARDEGFQEMLAKASVEAAQLRIPRPPGGRYYARVRALDSEGFASPFSSVQPVDVRSRPPGPRLAAPENGAVVAGESVLLKWYVQDGASRYRVQLAVDPRFTRPVVDRNDLANTSMGVGRPLEPGLYFWRVAASTHGDGEGAFSETRTLRVVPAAPDMSAPEILGHRVVFHWRVPSVSPRYRLQVSKDAEFRTLVVDQRAGLTELGVPRLAPGRYFVRVCAEDADGVTGPFSPPQTVQVPAGSSSGLLPLIPFLFMP
jgi:hypothetical protein